MSSVLYLVHINNRRKKKRQKVKKKVIDFASIEKNRTKENRLSSFIALPVCQALPLTHFSI